MYNAILQGKSENTVYIKVKWEKEGNLNISEESWKKYVNYNGTEIAQTVGQMTPITSTSSGIARSLCPIDRKSINILIFGVNNFI